MKKEGSKQCRETELTREEPFTAKNKKKERGDFD